jgi:hypothetical protein
VLIRIVLLFTSAENTDPSLACRVLKDDIGKIELIVSHRVLPPPFEISIYEGGMVELSSVFTKISPTCRREILADCDAEAILISIEKHLRIFKRG